MKRRFRVCALLVSELDGSAIVAPSEAREGCDDGIEDRHGNAARIASATVAMAGVPADRAVVDSEHLDGLAAARDTIGTIGALVDG